MLQPLSNFPKCRRLLVPEPTWKSRECRIGRHKLRGHIAQLLGTVLLIALTFQFWVVRLKVEYLFKAGIDWDGIRSSLWGWRLEKRPEPGR